MDESGLLENAKRHAEQTVGVRRDLHKHPELRFEENRTASIVAEHLRRLGLEVRTGVGATGVVGLLRGGTDGPCIALRADMDALPIHERNEVSYASTVPGVMHACGHDVHTAVLLGAADVLTSVRERIPGIVKFLFQPAEEIPCCAKSGAQAMISDGALKDPPVAAILGFHCWPDLKAGQIGINPEAAMASAEGFRIEIAGTSAHAGTPHRGNDALLAMAETVVGLHHIVSRQVDPNEPVALNVGTVRGGESQSIVAGKVEITGTIRTIHEETRHSVEAAIERCVSGTCRVYGTSYELQFTTCFPPVINDRQLVQLARRVAGKTVGQGNTVLMRACPMTAEDFTFYLQEVPGLYLKIGVADACTGEGYALHHERFDVDERAIPVAVAMLSALACEYLDERSKGRT